MTSVRRVLITDHPWGNADIEREQLCPHGIEVIADPDASESSLQTLAANVDAIATCWAKVTRRIIEAAPRLRHIARMGIGLDNIDVESATRRKIVVTNVPDYCVAEVADHAMALLFACIRSVAFFDHRIKQGEYQLSAGPPMHRLKGRTLGLVGFGRIAREVYTRAKPFGLDVQATSTSGHDYGTGCRMVSLADLLSSSDYVSLHAPLTPETRHLLREETLRLMKPAAFVINTSRGGLIDEQALWTSIREGRIAGAGLDVFEREPPDLSRPLFTDERVVMTPHAAFVSEESVIELRQRVSQQILDVFEGRSPENVVNAISVSD